MKFLLLILTQVALADCPKSLSDWRTFSHNQTSRLFDSGFKGTLALEIQSSFKECEASLAEIPTARLCTKPLVRFASALGVDTLPGHSLGTKWTDTEYYQNIPYPEMMELPEQIRSNQKFLRALDQRSEAGYQEALRMIEEINAAISDPELKWTAFIYDSLHLAPPDQSDALGRFFIHIPHPDHERFLQFGLQRNPNKKLPNGLSTVSIQKTDPITHETLAVPKARLKDFWRKRDASGNVTVSTRLKEVGRMENCYDCHKTVLLPITPNPNVFNAAQFGEKLKFVNERMKLYATAEAEGYDMKGHGPGVGPLDLPTRTDAFIRKCSEGVVTDKNRIEVIRQSMNCAKCHDGMQRGVLNFPSAWMELPYGGTMIEHYVQRHRKMPVGATDLTDPERKALNDCLFDEFYGGSGVLKSYLQNKQCWEEN